MNNEPVGHLYPEGEGVTVYDIKFAWKVTGTTEPIPLYIHPADLTDEEIDDFTVRIYNCRTGAEAHEIVLAILRKASEK